MQVIPIETVEEAWNEVFAIESIADFESLLSKMQEKQPYLLPFLYAGGENMLQENEIGELLGMGVVVWISFQKASDGGMNIVQPQMLEELHSESIRLLEENSVEDALEETAVNFATGATQQPLLESILGYLLEGENDIAPDRQGIAFFLIKIIVDALDRSWKVQPSV